MRKLEVGEATGPLADYAQGVDKEPLILTVSGKPVAALVPIENADLETVGLSNDPTFLALIERSRTRHRVEGGVSSTEMRRKLGVVQAGRGRKQMG